jgi:hypothetical protein
MKRSQFTEEQIIGILREQEAGMATAEVCRKHGISQPTFYAWKSTEPRNTVTMGVTATRNSTFEWREIGAQVRAAKPKDRSPSSSS